MQRLDTLCLVANELLVDCGVVLVDLVLLVLGLHIYFVINYNYRRLLVEINYEYIRLQRFIYFQTNFDFFSNILYKHKTYSAATLV